MVGDMVEHLSGTEIMGAHFVKVVKDIFFDVIRNNVHVKWVSFLYILRMGEIIIYYICFVGKNSIFVKKCSMERNFTIL